MEQPKYIEANYVASQTFDVDEILEELNISWGDIESYGIKWTTLFLITKDGKTHEAHCQPGDIDWKRPFHTSEYDENYHEINIPF
tara:strand:- start:409 stop:663 length:255 start_codon:yes stop_codon:yes gene_type:complete